MVQYKQNIMSQYNNLLANLFLLLNMSSNQIWVTGITYITVRVLAHVVDYSGYSPGV